MSNVISLSAERIKRTTSGQRLSLFEQAQKEETERKKILRAMLIAQGYGKKAINTSDEGPNLYGSLWGLAPTEEYGFDKSFIADIKSKGLPHTADTEARVFYVWADSLKQASDLLGEYDSGSTGEVNEDGQIYMDFIGEYV